MNICFVSREFVGSKRAGGIATYVYDMSKALIAEGHNVFVLCASDNYRKEEMLIIDKINVIKLSRADFYINSNRYLKTIGSRIRSFLFYNSYRKKVAYALEKLNKDHQFDIVEFPEYGNEAKYWLKKENGVATIVRFHGPEGHDRGSNTINTKSTRVKQSLDTAFRADGLTFCSSAIKELIIKTPYSKQIIEKYAFPSKIIYNFINTKDKSIDALKNKEYIFTAGTFVDDKGFGELIEAVKLLNDEGGNLNLIIAGKLGKLGVLYKSKSENKLEYKNWLNILGQIKREELFSYYKNASLCCFPSWWDNMPLTCLESMSVGGLVLGSTSGGMKEIITDGKDGFLVAPKNVNLLKEKIIEILSLCKNDKNEVRCDAKDKVLNKFSEKIIIEEMVSFYNEVINSNKN